MTEQTRRATRLLRMANLLVRRGSLSAAELARELNYSQRTIQRDIAALESELGLPLVYEKRRYSVMAGGHLPLAPVRLTLQEARAVHFATRLYMRFADERDPDGISALQKIADTLPLPLAAHMERTVAEFRERPADEQYIQVLRTMTEAWTSSRAVTMAYRSQHAVSARTTELEPYLLDHTQSGTYVAGFSSTHGEVRVFKLDRIQSAELTERQFTPPNVDEIAEQLRRSWGGVVFSDENFDVTIDFTPDVATRIAETYWHPSQQLEPLPDGGVRLKVSLPSLLEFVPWVRGWGEAALVIAPAELRDEVARSLKSAAARYA